MRDSARQEQVRQIAEEHTMARFQFDQQPETGYGPGALNSVVYDQCPGGFVHGYTLEGEKN
jgi:hypothetical protein